MIRSLKTLIQLFFVFLTISVGINVQAQTTSRLVPDSEAGQVEKFKSLGFLKTAPFYASQMIEEIERNKGSGSRLSYVAEKESDNQLSQDNKNMQGDFYLLKAVPKYNPDSNVPFINNKKYNTLIREQIEKKGLKLFVSARRGSDVKGAAVLSGKTAFDKYPDSKGKPIIIMNLDSPMDIFVHESTHLDDKSSGNLSRRRAAIQNLANQVNSEAIPDRASKVFQQLSRACVETPALNVQEEFYQSLRVEDGPYTRINYIRENVDKNNGAILEPSNRANTKFLRHEISFQDYKKDVRESMDGYYDQLYRPLDRSLLAIHEAGKSKIHDNICNLFKNECDKKNSAAAKERLSSCYPSKDKNIEPAGSRNKSKITPPGVQ